jgi:hypothetical protein
MGFDPTHRKKSTSSSERAIEKRVKECWSRVGGSIVQPTAVSRIDEIADISEATKPGASLSARAGFSPYSAPQSSDFS